MDVHQGHISSEVLRQSCSKRLIMRSGGPVGLLTITCWKLLQAWQFNTIWQSKHSEEGIHVDQHPVKRNTGQIYRTTTQPFETNTLKVSQRAEPLWIATS